MSYLSPGDRRLWTMLKVFVELRDGTTLYIPFREASKVDFRPVLLRRRTSASNISAELAMGWALRL